MNNRPYAKYYCNQNSTGSCMPNRDNGNSDDLDSSPTEELPHEHPQQQNKDPSNPQPRELNNNTENQSSRESFDDLDTNEDLEHCHPQARANNTTEELSASEPSPDIESADVDDHVYPDYDSETDDSQDVDSIPAKVLVTVISAFQGLLHLKVLGLHKLIPVITGTTGKQEGISGKYYPNNMLRSDEEVVYAEQPSRWYSALEYTISWSFIVLGIVIYVLVLLGYGQAMLDTVTPSFWELSLPNEWWYFPATLFVVGVAMLIVTVFKRASVWHIVTDKRILHREGIIQPDETRLDFTSIEKINNRLPVPDRFVGMGYIDIYNASTGDQEPEVTLKGVLNSSSKSKLIDEARYDYIEKIRDQQAGNVSTERAQRQRESEARANQQQSSDHTQETGSGHPQARSSEQPHSNDGNRNRDDHTGV